jgi:Spy/CpxP family protein refolding chaperone
MWKPILAVLVIFAAGVVTGGLTLDLKRPPWKQTAGQRQEAGHRPYVSGRWDNQLRDILRRMEEKLNLTPDQRSRVTGIIRETQGRMKALWEDIAPKTREEMKQMRERIRAELSPEQRKKFEEIFKQRAERSHPRPAGAEDRTNKPPANP